MLAEDEQSFSGVFYPQEWEKNHHLTLRANPYYAGGRTYLDTVRVTVRREPGYPTCSWPAPASSRTISWNSIPASTRTSTCASCRATSARTPRSRSIRLLKRFNEATGFRYRELNSLTADEESPVAIRIKALSPQKTASILKFSEIKLYVLSSLSNLEKDLAAFLKGTNLKIETQFIDDSQFMAFLDSAAIKYALVDKIFQKKSPAEEKLSRILKESSFNRFNAQYLRMLSELEEARFSNSQELLHGADRPHQRGDHQRRLHFPPFPEKLLPLRPQVVAGHGDRLLRQAAAAKSEQKQ